MFKTKPFISKKVWGYEQWIVSAHPAGSSLVDDCGTAYHGKPIAAIVGQDYPLLVKVIQADDTLSVQVHPDDSYAAAHEHSAGKTECWYILDAKPNATLVCGLNGTYTRKELEHAITNKTLDRFLRYIPVTKGDFVFIPAGTVHAIQGGLRLLEVQQSSDITYRLYDWGRPREVHVQKGLDVIQHIDVVAHDKTTGATGRDTNRFAGFFSCPYFTLKSYTFTAAGSVCIAALVQDIFDACAEVNTALKTGWCGLFVLEGTGRMETLGTDNAHCVNTSSNVLYANTESKSIAIRAEDCFMIKVEETVQIIPTAGSSISVMLIY